MRQDLELSFASQLDLAVRAGRIPPYVVQWRGIPGRRYSFDFAWPAWKLTCEVQGGTWMPNRSGHSTGIGLQRGYEKQSLAAIHGIYTMACDSTQIKKGIALKWVIQFFKERGFNVYNW
jgi:hypothetical protein